MLYTQIRSIRLEDGRERHVLFGRDSDGVFIPLYYPNLFISTILNGSPSDTIKQALSAIRCLLAWAVRENIDIVARMRSFEFLRSDTELLNLKAALMLYYPSLFEQAEKSILSRQATSKALKLTQPKKVNNNTVNLRLFYIKRYLKWLAEDNTARLTKAEKEEVDIQIKNQTKWFRNNTLETIETTPGKPLTEEQAKILWDVIQPTAYNNPWGKEVRFRNYVIIRTYWETGVRKSEIMCFRTIDMPKGANCINLIKIPNNPQDPRKAKGKIKTKGRPLPLSSPMVQLLNDYKTGDRQLSRKANKHNFLFTSTTGAPISLSSITNIFEKLNTIEGLENLSPHDLRHDFATRLLERFKASGDDDKTAADRMRKFLGWSANSNMPAHYTAVLAEEEVRQMSLEQQRRLETA